MFAAPGRQGRSLSATAASCMRFAVLGAALLAAAPASAAPWVIDPANSQIEITYSEDNEPRTGTFAIFEGRGEFDPAQPEQAELTLTFETASIELEDVFRSEFVQTEAWFDSRRHPQASFVLDELEALKNGQHRAVGTLTIKGHSQPIEFLLTLQVENGLARASGSVSFDRLDFRLGDRTGSFLLEIGQQIDVAFSLTAQAQ